MTSKVGPVLVVYGTTIPDLAISKFSMGVPVGISSTMGRVVIPTDVVVPFEDARVPGDFFALYVSPTPWLCPVGKHVP